MRKEHHRMAALTLVLMGCLAAPVWASSDAKQNDQQAIDQKREEIDEMARETMRELLEESPQAKELYGKAFGYAIFQASKVAVGVTGGGGKGVAVNQKTDARTYMKMGTIGVGVGLGGQLYRVVFLFQDEATFRQFVDKGWEAEAQANAAAGRAGANAGTSFTNGLAVFQLTDGGLLASADIAGSKYWKNEKLN